MRIASLEAIPYFLPFEHPYVTARGVLERREMILVRLTTSGGPVGLGEAVPMSLRGGTDLASVERELREGCEPLLVGQKVTMNSIAGLITGVAAAGASAP